MEGRNGRKRNRTRIRMLSLHISTQDNTDGVTDLQTSKCLPSAVGNWAVAEIGGKYCVLLPVRDLQDCSLWRSLSKTACADSSLMTRALYFPWLPHEENGCNCSKEIVAMHGKMWIFYDITWLVIRKSSLCWKLWASLIPREKNWHINIQENTITIILICFEIHVLTLATALILMFKSTSRSGWKILMCESKWCTQLSVLLGHSARDSSARATRCLHILSIHKLWNCIREDMTVLLTWIHYSMWASNQWSLSVICPPGMGETGPLERIGAITP